MEGLVSQASQHSRSSCKGQASTTCWEDLQAEMETREGEIDAGCTFGRAAVLSVSVSMQLDSD